MSNNYTVYIHKNKINNKIYVGQTCKNVWERWRRDGSGYFSSDTKFKQAIIKYGFDNFEHIIIATNLTKEEANLMEKELIKKYDSFQNGYNSTLGGEGGGYLGHHHSQESIEKMVHYGSENGMYGKKRPDYVKEAISKAHAKPIKQFDLQGNLIKEWESAAQVKRETGYDNSFILKCCKNKNHTAYGHYWRYSDDTF